MEAAGSPVTDALVDKIKLKVTADNFTWAIEWLAEKSRHFEQLAGAIEAQAVERCANEVPTNWLDPLLTGPKAVIKGLDNRQIEALLRGIQDRIRALPRASDRRNGERRIQDYVYEGLPKRSGTDRRKGEA